MQQFLLNFDASFGDNYCALLLIVMDAKPVINLQPPLEIPNDIKFFAPFKRQIPTIQRIRFHSFMKNGIPSPWIQIEVKNEMVIFTSLPFFVLLPLERKKEMESDKKKIRRRKYERFMEYWVWKNWKYFERGGIEINIDFQ